MGNRRLLAWALVAALGGALITATPAQAASTTVLCVGYDSCARKGYDDHGYKEKRFNLFWRMSGDHNCTNYVASILVAKGMPNVRPWVGDGNAHAWGDFTTDRRDQTPVVGAVAWWDSNQPPVSSAGHVAYVERVISSTEIIISEDNWQGEFRWKRLTKSGGQWPTSFIHLRDARTPPPPHASATLLTQGVFTDSTRAKTRLSTAMKPGSTAWVHLTYRNTGSATWRGVTLQTVAPQPLAGRDSALSAGTTPVVAVQKEAIVEPGKVATFAFEATIPVDAAIGTTWAEQFVPRTARGSWMPQSAAAVTFTAKAGEYLALQPRPTIGGVRKQGETLTAIPGVWDAGTTLSFSWKRNGVRIAGATAATYVPTAQDVGTRLSVTTTAAASGRLPATQDSNPTGYIGSQISNTLNRGETLASGAQLISRNGIFALTQRADGNLVIHDRRTGVPLWASAISSTGARSRLNAAGSLATVSTGGTVVWTTATAREGVTRAVLRNDGRFALYTAANRIEWSSYTSGR